MMSDKGFVMPPRKRFANKLSTEFRVDHSGLLGVTRDMTDPDDFSESRKILAEMREEMSKGDANEAAVHEEEVLPHKEARTKLAEDLTSYIRMRGPISLHDYIGQTSNHVIHGYYQQAAEKIGSGGDFVTSPEISQLFGEMVAIWLLSAWKSMGSPKNVNLVELGPGKGTLMKDILRISSQFPEFKDAISVHMVELSDNMRTLQRESVGCSGEISKSTKGVTRMTNVDGIPISWYSTFSQVSNSDPVLLVAQEFLDVFPVHQFVYTKKGWREKLVDIDLSSSPLHFRQVLSPKETPAARALLGEGMGTGAQRNREKLNSVPMIPIEGNVTDGEDSASSNNSIKDQLKVGDEIEISPLALSTIEYISKRVIASRGAVLLIDYGEQFTQGDSLRAFKKHKQVSLYSEPGAVDITADVDFSMCIKTAEKIGAKVHGSITQGEFLMSMGIVKRVEKVIELPTTSDDAAEDMVVSFRRLVGDDEGALGKRFKVMAITDPLTHVEGFGAPVCHNNNE